MDNLVGKSYRFDDGSSISVTQVKNRDEGVQLVTYNIQQGPGLPRKLVMTMDEFVSTFGHLFRPKKEND